MFPNILPINENIYSKNVFCSRITTAYLMDYGSTHQYPNKVPKIIHYVFKTAYIPTQYSPHVKNCMETNKDAKFVFWSDFVGYRFMMNHFHNYIKLYSSYFEKNIDLLKISDMIRYFVLYKFGGIYMDLDTKCQKSFDVVMLNSSCILSQEVNEQTRILHNLPYLAMNSFIATTSKHDFFNYIIGKLTKADSSYILSQTGPIFLTNVFEDYKKLQSNKSNSLEPVILADPYIYSPHTETYLEHPCSKPKGKWQIQGCKDLKMHRKLQSMKSKEAVVVHLFMHLGYSRGSIKILDNVCAFKNNIYVVSY